MVLQCINLRKIYFQSPKILSFVSINSYAFFFFSLSPASIFEIFGFFLNGVNKIIDFSVKK